MANMSNKKSGVQESGLSVSRPCTFNAHVKKKGARIRRFLKMSFSELVRPITELQVLSAKTVSKKIVS